MPLEIRHTNAARRDLRGIWNYISIDNAVAADRQLRRIADKIMLLSRTPNIARMREDLAPGLKSTPVGRYLIFFDSDDTTLRIVRVLNSARDITSGLFEGD